MDGSCTIAGCKQAAACSLGGRVYCRDHIVAAGYEHLDSISAQLKAGKHKSTEHSEEMSRSLNRIFGELTAYCMEAGGLSHMERAQLLDLLLMAGELHRRLRREPRQLASVAVRISYRRAP